MGRYGHNRAGAVSHHNIICNIDRNLLACQRMNRAQPVDTDSGLLFYQLSTLKLRLLCAYFSVFLNRIHVADLICIFINHRMLRRNYHKGNAKQRIRTSRVDAERLFFVSKAEIYKRTFRFADPVYLLLSDIR